MNEKQKKAKKEGLELTLERLKFDSRVAAKELGEIYSKRDIAIGEINVAKEEARKQFENIKLQRSGIEQDKLGIVREREKLSGETVSHISILREIDVKKNTSLGELNRVNKWILKGEDRLIVLKQEQEKLKDICDNVKFAEKREKEVNKEILKLEKTRNDYRRQVGDLENVRSIETELIEDKLSKIRKETDLLEEAANSAESRKKNFDNEYDRKSRDLKIYEERIGKKYKKTFPGHLVKLK